VPCLSGTKNARRRALGPSARRRYWKKRSKEEKGGRNRFQSETGEIGTGEPVADLDGEDIGGEQLDDAVAEVVAQPEGLIGVGASRNLFSPMLVQSSPTNSSKVFFLL
jgi:hypothetical protein